MIKGTTHSQTWWIVSQGAACLTPWLRLESATPGKKESATKKREGHNVVVPVDRGNNRGQGSSEGIQSR